MAALRHAGRRLCERALQRGGPQVIPSGRRSMFISIGGKVRALLSRSLQSLCPPPPYKIRRPTAAIWSSRCCANLKFFFLLAEPKRVREILDLSPNWD
uniref:Uncharacterized protein n=1 Tax=Aegilops tauschii subsp. strangulata TaxID=200361 RepID=A0A452ZVC2_AEGTS